MEQYDLEQGHGFEQIDADAVCERCGTVNDEGTLLCKSCGNNLRDQRNRRIAEGTGPDLMSDGKNKFQLLTGLLIVFGFLAVSYTVWNIDRFEEIMAGAMATDATGAVRDFWAGAEAPIYDEMLQDLMDNPTSTQALKSSLENPQAEQSYNGRYLVILPGELTTNRVIGEANLRRMGDSVHFVYISRNREMEARGFARFETVEESGSTNITVRQTAEVRIDGVPHIGMGVSTPIAIGGHTCFVMTDGDGDPVEALAYRVHSNQ